MGSTVVAFLVEPYTVVEELAMVHLLGVLVIALRSDVRVSVFATVISFLSFLYFSSLRACRSVCTTTTNR